MSKMSSSKLIPTANPTSSKRIKNTFADDCGNKDFSAPELFGLCRYGFPYKDLPDEAKEMLDAYLVEYRKRCTGPNDDWDPPLPELPQGKGIVYG